MRPIKKIAPDVQAELAVLIEAIFDKNIARSRLIELASKLADGGQK